MENCSPHRVLAKTGPPKRRVKNMKNIFHSGFSLHFPPCFSLAFRGPDCESLTGPNREPKLMFFTTLGAAIFHQLFRPTGPPHLLALRGQGLPIVQKKALVTTQSMRRQLVEGGCCNTKTKTGLSLSMSSLNNQS